MREVHIGGVVVPVAATPLTMLFYRQEFDSEITSDLIDIDAEVDEGTGLVSLDALEVLDAMQVVWAMAKAAAFPSTWPSFASWISRFHDEDIFDGDFLSGALEIADDGLLVTTAPGDGCGSDDEFEPPPRIDTEWLAVGIRAGLGFSEINMLRVQDLVALMDSLTSEPIRTREATQSDIDAFLA